MLKRCVELDPLFQKGLNTLFFIAREAGATELEMLALLHTQMSRGLSQMAPDEQAAVIQIGSIYFDACHGEHEVA